MKNRLFTLILIPALPTIIAVTVSTLFTPTGHAQISTNLDALPKRHKTPAPHTHSRSSTHTHHSNTPHTPSSSPPSVATEPSHPSPTPPGYTKVPSVPVAAPAPVVLAPPFVPVPKHPPVPPEAVLPVEKAHSRTIALNTHNLRVLFDTNSAAMNGKTLTALQNFGQTLAEHPEKRLVLKSYATLPGDDVSMPRRMALARALAVRSVLIHAGIATTRIYPIAYGRPEVQPSDGKDRISLPPADRLDICVEENPPTLITPISGAPSSTQHASSQGATP